MAHEWLLNSATNRFQLNYKRNVGAVAEEIRKCAPKTIGEWRSYYFCKVKTQNHIEELGRKLYVKITEVLASELETISEQECIDYLLALVINRTYDGYDTEIKTIYGQLQANLDVTIKAASDVWDRKYNVDFFIPIKDSYIGLQIKPISDTSHIPQIHKERTIQKNTHDVFQKKFGGNVFYIFSIKQNGKKIICNPTVIEEIRQEMKRLGG